MDTTVIGKSSRGVESELEGVVRLQNAGVKCAGIAGHGMRGAIHIGPGDSGAFRNRNALRYKREVVNHHAGDIGRGRGRLGSGRGSGRCHRARQRLRLRRRLQQRGCDTEGLRVGLIMIQWGCLYFNKVAAREAAFAASLCLK